MKRIFSLFISVIFVFNMFVFTPVHAESIDEGEMYYEKSVGVLTALKIADFSESYEDAFEINVTRAEAVNAIMRCIIKESGNTATGSRNANISKSPYDDVPLSAWYAANVSYAKDMGLISDSSNFYPDDIITYSEFAKLAVGALGYSIVAEQKGGYPTGYNAMMAELDLRDNTSGAYELLTKSDFAIILFNVLMTRGIVQTSYGDNEYYEKGNVTLLESTFDVINTRGRVMTTSKSSVSSSKYCEDNFAKIDTDEGSYLFYSEKIDFDEYLGRVVDMYYIEKDYRNELLFVDSYYDNEDVIEISQEEFDGFTRKDKKIEYHKTFSEHIWDSTTKKGSVKISDDCDILINGVFTNDISKAFDILEEKTLNLEKIRLIDSDNSRGIDLIDIVAYYTIFTSAVNNNEKTIADRYNKTVLQLEPEKGEVVYEIYNAKNMRAMDLSSIEKRNIVSVYEGIGEKKSYKLIVSAVTTKAFAKSKIPSDFLLETDDDIEYKFSNSIKNKINEIELGKEYTFYLDACGRIAAYEHVDYTSPYDEYGLREESNSKRGVFHGIIVAASKPTGGFDETILLKIYTTQGIMEIYEVSEKCRFAEGKFNSDNYDSVMALIDKQLVQFELNDAGLVSKISLPETTRQNGKLSYANGFSTGKLNLTFKANANVFYGSAYTAIRSKSTIIACPSEDYMGDIDQAYSIVGVDKFSNDEKYEIQAFYTGTDRVVADVLLYYTASAKSISSTSGFFVVRDTCMALNKEDSAAKKITGYYNGKSAEYFSAYTEFVDEDGNNVDVSSGDILQISINSGNEVEVVKKVYDYDKPENYKNASSYSNAGRIVRGAVYDVDSNAICYIKNSFDVNLDDINNGANVTEIQSLNSARIYVFEELRNGCTLVKGSYADFVAYDDDPVNYSKIVVANHYGNAGATYVIYKN